MKYVIKHGFFGQPEMRIVVIWMCTRMYYSIHVQVQVVKIWNLLHEFKNGRHVHTRIHLLLSDDLAEARIPLAYPSEEFRYAHCTGFNSSPQSKTTF